MDQLVENRDLIVTSPPIIQEVLQGFDDDHLTVVHRDRDYAQIAKVIALNHRDIGRLLKDANR